MKWVYLAVLFIYSHFNNRRTVENIILISPNRSIRTIADVGDDNVSRTIRFQPELPETWTQVVGSCNGLVLLLNREKRLFLVNPTTFKQVKIPDSPGVNQGSWFVYRLGYDAATDDYKIVTISDRDIVKDFMLDYEDTFVLRYAFVYMYSMRKGVWKRLERFHYYHAVAPLVDGHKLWAGAFVNGSIHWLAYTREETEGLAYTREETLGSSVIAAFDLVDEKFKEIPAPGCLDVKTFAHNELVVLKGCLCMFDKWYSSDQLDIWIMEEYGIEKSWVKLSITRGGDWAMVKPLCFIGDDKIVLVTNGYRLIIYIFKTGTLSDFMVDGVPATYEDRGTFLDSLVWPSYSNLM